MKLNAKIMQTSDVKFDNSLIYTALKYNFIDVDEVVQYFIQLINTKDEEVGEFMIDLLCGNIKEKDDILYKMEHDGIIEKMSIDEDIELKKIRYLILKDLKDKINDKENLLKEIEQVFSDFNYPEDMREFIYYMPNNKTVKIKSMNECEKYLLHLFNNFLEEEKKRWFVI